MNAWVFPLSFGCVFLSLKNKLFSSSGFKYKLAHGIDDTGLYKSTSWNFLDAYLYIYIQYTWYIFMCTVIT